MLVKAGKRNALVKGYKVSYHNNKNVGKASVVIKGKGIYKGKIKRTFKINPKGTKISKIKKKNGYVIVKWDKQARTMSKSRITGYQLQIAANKKFTKKKKTVTIKGYKKASKKFSKIKGKYRFFRIRTYKIVKGENYFSSWSKVKRAKVK